MSDTTKDRKDLTASQKRIATIMARHGSDFFSRIGSKGGTANMRNNGRSHLADIGRRGGETMKRTRGRDYYQTIGRMSAKGLDL